MTPTEAIEHYKAQLYQNARFVCDVCCEKGQVFIDIDGSLVFNCPDHMRLVLGNGKVLASQTLGVRH